jgi:hypothetical protein
MREGRWKAGVDGRFLHGWGESRTWPMPDLRSLRTRARARVWRWFTLVPRRLSTCLLQRSDNSQCTYMVDRYSGIGWMRVIHKLDGMSKVADKNAVAVIWSGGGM